MLFPVSRNFLDHVRDRDCLIPRQAGTDGFKIVDRLDAAGLPVVCRRYRIVDHSGSPVCWKCAWRMSEISSANAGGTPSKFRASSLKAFASSSFNSIVNLIA